MKNFDLVWPGALLRNGGCVKSYPTSQTGLSRPAWHPARENTATRTFPLPLAEAMPGYRSYWGAAEIAEAIEQRELKVR